MNIAKEIQRRLHKGVGNMKSGAQKWEKIVDFLKVLVIQDDSANMGLESSKPQQLQMKLQQKELTIQIIRNLECIENIKIEFNDLRQECNRIANSILLLKKDVEDRFRNSLPAIKQVDRILLSLNDKDYKVVTRLKQPRPWMLEMFDIFLTISN